MTRKNVRRVATWGAAALALIVLIGLSLIPRPVACDLEEVVRGELRVTLDHEGKTRVRDRFVISAPLSGRVLRIDLEPGDPVRAGETILAIFQPSQPVPLDARSRAEARARVGAAQAALDRARAERNRVQTEHDFAMRERERLRRLASQGIVAQGELDAAESDAGGQAEALLAAEAAVRNVTHELELAHAHLLEPGEATGASGGTVLSLRSPVDGVVLRRLRQSEAVVPTGEPLLEVADPRDLEIVADFLSTDAVRMRAGMAVLLDRWGGEEVLQGQVRRVEPSGFMKVSALGVEEQRVNVIVDLLDPDRATGLGDAYRVEVRVIVQSLDDVVKAPTSALFRHAGGWAVFVAEGGRARLRPVVVGRSNDTEAGILDGLAAGETVVAYPSEQVADGIRVDRRES